MAWHVHKFGGTSLANASRYRNAASIVDRQTDRRQAVVVSAMSGVTDALIELIEFACTRRKYSDALDELKERQLGVVNDLLGSGAAEVSASIESDFSDIADVLRALWLLKSKPGHALSLISGYGEIWSARLLASHLAERGVDAVWLDAREVLVVETSNHTSPFVDWALSRGKLDAWCSARKDAGHLDQVVVITGYIAVDTHGAPTTLGRNGSDYSASIFGALLGAESIEIWTDVDGVMSADPRLVPDALVLEALSYSEAMELAYFGAKVIHPSTMTPAVGNSIPITIRNSMHVEAPGTRIHTTTSSDHPVKGIASVEDMALINVEGTSLIGVPGIASRLFDALRQADVNVVMISQGSSEHSICFVVPQADATAARNAVEDAFYAERRHGQVQTIDVHDNCAILAIVGDNMAGTSGVAATFFGALGKSGINIRAVAQGSSERNISVVVDSAVVTRAIRAVHSAFYLSNQTLSIGIIGPGVVGSKLIEQLREQIPRLEEEFRIDLRVRGLATRSNTLLDEHHVDLGTWADALPSAPTLDLADFVDHIDTDALPHAVIIDCTASENVARHYEAWLRRGIHVITPNKRANSIDFDYYATLKSLARQIGVHYLYETTVGAGLPIIQTLHDLIQTGDRVERIEGIFSGTLSYLFNSYDGTRAFSEIVREARKLGYTEPDPRDDLSGMDVARKLVILAREMGVKLELEDVKVESLVPEGLDEGDVESFLNALSDHDAEMESRLTEAREAGECLRFIGSVDATGEAAVRLERCSASHPFARIRSTDNIVQYTTRRYSENPLVVQGPGAGPAVTAGGIFGDLLRLATYLGAPR